MKFILTFMVTAWCSMVRADITTSEKYDFVVSIPDVHGDFDVLLRALWMAKIEVDGSNAAGEFDNFRNSFENAIKADLPRKRNENARVLLVQTGDIIDRGAASLSCYKAIWQVEGLLGWDLINLVGNHEVMTMAGQADNYAHPADVREFGSLKARRAAFSPGGKIWTKIIDEFQFMAKINMGSESILFVHAGMHPKWLKQVRRSSVDELNAFLMDELLKNPSSPVLVSAIGPIWTREMAQDVDDVVCKRLLPPVQQTLKVSRIVVGHTPQETLTTTSRCDAQILLADVAMSRWMGSGKNGNPAALIFSLSEKGQKLTRIYNVYWRNGQVVDQPIASLVDDSSSHEL